MGFREDNDVLVNDAEDDVAVSVHNGEGERRELLNVPPPPVPTFEMQRPRVMRTPSAPSHQERADQDSAHCPFKVWCEVCVAGKSHAKSLVNGHAGTPESDVAMVAFYYTFISDNGSHGSGNTELEREQNEKDNQVDILVGGERKSKCYVAIAMPCKSVNESEYAPSACCASSTAWAMIV